MAHIPANIIRMMRKKRLAMPSSGNAPGSASGASKRSWMPGLKRSTATTFTSKAEAETQNPATPSAPRERLAGFLPPHALPPTGPGA